MEKMGVLIITKFEQFKGKDPAVMNRHEEFTV